MKWDYNFMNNIKTYNEFLEKLKLLNLELNDLHKHACMTPTQLRRFKSDFKNNKDSEEEWANFKEDDFNYYCVVRMNPHIAYSNKYRSKKFSDLIDDES